MAEAIVGPLVAKLQDLALSEAKALVAVNGDIQSLRDRLMWMQAFLRHADQRRRNTYDELIRVWIKQTRDAAFDAEDAIDLFVFKVDLSRDPSWAQSIIRFFAGFTTQVCIRHNLSTKIAEINSRLEDIIKNKEKYMIEFGLNDSARVLWGPSPIIPMVTMKMDDFQAPLVQERRGADVFSASLLDTEPMKLAVVNVVGERGVGKATLVREVYERPKTQALFEERVWASFPPYLSVSNILQLIYLQLCSESCEDNDVEKSVQKKLEGKKFLLVIDGEVSNTDWIALESVLPENNGKSCRVVRIMQGSHQKPPEIQLENWITLYPFDQAQTREVFQKWAPKEGNREEGKPGDEIVQIMSMTGGLPLAVVLLCGLLQTKEYPNEWIAVFEHLRSKQSNQSKRLDMILTMCFDDLPHELKSCFLYFAALPVNTAIEAHKLVYMWMAEGFLRPKDGKTKEKVGRIYLKNLVARALIKVVKKDFFSGDQFVAVHHEVHAFLQREAQEANFVEIHNGDDTPSLTTARRLSLQNYTDKYAALANSLPKLRSILSIVFRTIENVGEVDNKEKEEDEGDITRAEGVQNRTNRNAKDEAAPDGILGSGMLRCWGQGINRQGRIKSYIRGMLQESRFLRVVNLQGVEIGKKLPATIRNVAHLQYLGVTACSLKLIPPEIGELKDLQTLDVRDTLVRKLPASFWKIKTLRHVFGSGLILPKQVGNLKYLQTLETIQPDEKYGWDGKTFERMVHLQSLYIQDSSGDTAIVDALCDALCGLIKNPKLLEYLEKLILKASKIPCEVFTSRSQRRLRAMALRGKLDFPKHDLCVPNLTFLSLESTKVSQDFICKLGKLPLLANLILDKKSYKDDQGLVFADNEFRSLKKLTLSHLKKLMKIVIGKTALPELTHLVILSYNVDINIEVECKCEKETSAKGKEQCNKSKFVKKIKGEDDILYARIRQNPVHQAARRQQEITGKQTCYGVRCSNVWQKINFWS